jgi:hypothetical protein
MAETIHWLYSVRAQGGPSTSLHGHFEADAYEKMNVTVPATSAQLITIGSATWADIIGLMVSANDLSGDVTVQPDGGPVLPIDAPIVLLGTGAMGLLGGGNATLNLDNTSAEDVDVDIFVSRDATP